MEVSSCRTRGGLKVWTAPTPMSPGPLLYTHWYYKNWIAKTLLECNVKLRTNSIDASDNARLLGVLISAGLSFDRHVTKVAEQCFYQLCQLRSVRKSLDADSAATLSHLQSRRLLLQCTHQFTAISHWQTPDSDECSRTSYHKHWQVWARSVILLASGISLAGCARTDSVHSCC